MDLNGKIVLGLLGAPLASCDLVMTAQPAVTQRSSPEQLGGRPSSFWGCSWGQV